MYQEYKINKQTKPNYRKDYMETLTVDLATMYGDHHVTEVRRILFDIPGVEDLYASSSFHQVQITFDKKKTSEKEIMEKLEKAGYIGELPVEVEKPGARPSNEDQPPFFRHSTSYPQTKKTVGFMQKVSYQGRPLWPCPGMGPLKVKDE
jgi:copper chaperone CopZ